MIQFRVEKDGEAIFHKEQPDVAASAPNLAAFVANCIGEFMGKHPTLHLTDDRIWLKISRLDR